MAAKKINSVRVVEVGARDGLQNEPMFKRLPLPELVQKRVQFITALAEAGLQDVEAGAFVRADRIPQMEATDQVLKILQKDYPLLWRKKRFWTLVPNRKGMEMAIAAGAKHVSVFTATSDAFNQKNIQMTVKESLKQLKEVFQLARSEKISVRGYISTVWGCPYTGKTSPQKALNVAETLLDMGAEEISLGDTIGVATPKQVEQVLALFPKKWPLAVHFHDTRGTAIANCLQAIAQGIRVVDSSAGGIGGCPYAKGASGNLATEDLLYMLKRMGFQTGVDMEKVCIAAETMAEGLHLNLPSRFHKAWKGSRAENE